MWDLVFQSIIFFFSVFLSTVNTVCVAHIPELLKVIAKKSIVSEKEKFSFASFSVLFLLYANEKVWKKY